MISALPVLHSLLAAGYAAVYSSEAAANRRIHEQLSQVNQGSLFGSNYDYRSDLGSYRSGSDSLSSTAFDQSGSGYKYRTRTGNGLGSSSSLLNYNSGSSYHGSSRSGRVECYSCASDFYTQFVKMDSAISGLLTTPRTVSDSCDRGRFDPTAMGTRICDSHCLYLFTHNNILGRDYPLYYRGCLEDVRRLNWTHIARYARNHPCVEGSYRTLFLNERRDGDLRMCFCTDNHCNTAAQLFSNFFVLSVVMLILWSYS